MKKLVCSVLFAATAAGSASAETVFWYRFDEKAVGTTLAVDDTLADEMGGDGAVVKKTKNSPQAPKIAEGVPFKFRDPVADKTYTSTGSFDVDNPTGYGAHYYLEVPGRKGMTGNAFTVEGFFRFDTRRVAGPNGMWSGKLGMCFFQQGNLWRFGSDGDGFWEFNGCSVMGEAVTVSGMSIGGTANRIMEDELWHHVAVVYDGTNPEARTFKVFIDKRPVVSKENCPEIKVEEGSDPVPVWIGHSGASEASPFPGWIDEVRYTDAALDPDDFLEISDVWQDGDTLGWWRFEKDALGANKVCTFANEALTPLAMLPSASGAITVLAGAGADIKDSEGMLHSNTNAAYMYGNSLIVEDCPYIVKDGFTLEASYQWNEEGAGSRMVYSTGTTADFMSKATTVASRGDANGLYIYMKGTSSDGNARMLTVKMGGEEHQLTVSLEDWFSGWHHLAVTYDPTEHVLLVYKDYQEVMRWEDCPRLPEYDPTALRPVGILRGSAKPYFMTDEIRLTRGVLPVSKFLDFDLKTANLKKGDTLAHWYFDSDLKVTAKHPCVSGTCIYKATDVKWALTNGYDAVHDKVMDKTRGMRLHVNEGALSISNNYIAAYLAKAVSRDSPAPDALTFECFAKCENVARNYAQILHFRPNLLTWGSELFSVQQTGTEGELTVTSMGTTSRIAAGERPRMVQSKWHHIALSLRLTGEIDEDGKKIVEYKFYFDRKLVKTWTQTGSASIFTWKSLLTHFCWGGGTDGNGNEQSANSFYGDIDEVRVSYGALEPEDFLREMRGDGLMLLVK